MLISEMDGQGVKQFLELGCAFLLSAAIGLEREIRRKSAGLRTYTVVGTAAALFLLISSIHPVSPHRSSPASAL